MTDYAALADRMFGTPLLVDAAKAAVIAQAFAPRIFGSATAAVDLRGAPAVNEEARRQPRASFLGDEVYHSLKSRPGAGYSIINGVAVIPVVGTLVRRGAYVGSMSGVTSYEGISALVRAAAANPEVRAIALEIDTFGGEAMGVFDLAADIRAAREKKPVHAFVSHYALSAGYAIASQATEIVAPPLAKIGSIGVVSMHVDYSGQLEKEGIAVTLIQSGKHKTEGNPFEALPDAVREDMQAEAARLRSRFAAEVEMGRGQRLSAANAIRTEAKVYGAEEARALGLVDRVEELRTAFAELSDWSEPEPADRTARAVAHQVLTTAEAPALAVAATAPDTSPARPRDIDLIAGLIRAIESEPALQDTAGAQASAQTGAPALSEEEAGMTDQTETKAPDNKTPAATTTENTPEATTPDAGAAATDRASNILAKCERAGLSMSFAQGLIQSGCTLEQAYDQIIDAKAAKAEDGGDIVNTVSARVTGDAVDRTREGMTQSLLARAGLKGGERNEFSGMTLMELARQSLIVRGLAIPTGGKMAVVAAAFVPSMAGGMHSSSDFGNILADVAHKSMLKGFEEQPETFEMFTSVGTMSDFKPHRRVGLDAFPALTKVEEGAEFKFGTLGDHGELAVLATYGKLFSITRQAIINDDLDAMTKIPGKMGRAARRTVGDLVFAVLTGNPTMSDGTALFHADHGNLGSAAAPSEAAINAAITAMSRQTDRSANATALNIRPEYLIAAPEQRSTVLQSLNSEYAPDDTDKAGTAKQPRAANTVRDAAKPIFDARLPTGAWFMAADPNVADTIEVGYLDGVSTPFLEQKDGWTIDGTEFKVRLDATATPLAWEGLFKNPGA